MGLEAWGMGHGARTQRLMYLQGTSAPAWYRLEGESLMPRVYRKGTPLEKRTKSAKEALRSTGLDTASTATIDDESSPPMEVKNRIWSGSRQ